jgi:hypothetical protein
VLEAVIEEVKCWTGPLARRTAPSTSLRAGLGGCAHGVWGWTADGGCPHVSFFGEFAGVVAAFADDDWTGQATCNQEWLVTEVAWCAVGIE